MIPEPVINVGIITDGYPVTSPAGKWTRVHNVLIGDGFHWQKRVKATFKGELIPLAEAQGNIHIINRIPVEQYLQSVIGSEMNPNAPSEFLKAHAVISRSWALRKIRGTATSLSEGKVRDADRIIEWEESDSHVGFDVCSDDHCQRYQGIHGETDKKTLSAVAETRGLILTTTTDEIADTRFSKCCGGMTEHFNACWSDTDHDYLPAQHDPWCDLSDMPEDRRISFLSAVMKDYDHLTTIDFKTWRAEVSPTEVATRLIDKYGINIGKIMHLRPINRGKSGRIIEMLIEGSEGTISIGKTLPIRRLLAADCLKSSWFDIEERYGTFILHGHGWGHGVGLCQIGAARMAAEGYDFHDILKFYYPGTKLTRLYE